MKPYTFIGAVFVIIGFAILIVGIVLMVQAYQAIQALSAIGAGSVKYLEGGLYDVFGPYLVGSTVFFVIGGLGFYAGRSNEPDVTVSIRNDTATLHNPNSANDPNSSYETRPGSPYAGRSVILCGSCGTTNDIDAVFCKKCGKPFS